MFNNPSVRKLGNLDAERWILMRIYSDANPGVDRIVKILDAISRSLISDNFLITETRDIQIWIYKNIEYIKIQIEFQRDFKIIVTYPIQRKYYNRCPWVILIQSEWKYYGSNVTYTMLEISSFIEPFSVQVRRSRENDAFQSVRFTIHRS